MKKTFLSYFKIIIFTVLIIVLSLYGTSTLKSYKTLSQFKEYNIDIIDNNTSSIYETSNNSTNSLESPSSINSKSDTVKKAEISKTSTTTNNKFSSSSPITSKSSSQPSKKSITTAKPSSSSTYINTSSPTPVSKPSANSKIVLGYYGSWGAYSGYIPLNIPASKLTHINYAFANIGNDLKISLGDPNVDLSNFSKLNALKIKYPGIKTLISVGGWDWSGKFSDVALSDSSRTIFADSVIQFIKQYGFDGIDIDWEFPVSGGLSSNTKRPEDKRNFTLLLQKIREKLNSQAAKDNKNYLLTIAGGAGTSYTINTELSSISKYIDFANLMTYDIHGTWDKYTDFNSPLYNPPESSPQYKWSIDSAVKAWTLRGFPTSKIVVGIPFYGHIYYGINNINNGMFQTFTSGSSITYDKLVSTYLNNNNFLKFRHNTAKVPWLFNGSTFISYDDELSIAEKAKYIKSKNLAGAMVWELSQNRNGNLLNTLYQNIH